MSTRSLLIVTVGGAALLACGGSTSTNLMGGAGTGSGAHSGSGGGLRESSLSGTGGTGAGLSSHQATTGSTAGGTTTTTGPAALVNPPPGSKFFPGANFWRVDWEGPDDFFLPNSDWATVTNPWQPQLLTDLAPHHVLRFMDWNLTNSDPNPQSVWSTRKQKTQSQTNEPIAFEWQIDLCNRTLKDYWLNVPIQADATYQANLAHLVYKQLDPRLRVYVEYSNEVWNAGFPQNGIAAKNAVSWGLPSTPSSCCGASTVQVGNAYVYGAVRMFEAFEAVFGKNNPRLVKVLSGQGGWDGPCKTHMAALQDNTINPNGTTPTAYAIAPYVSGTSVAALQANVPSTAAMATSHLACISKLKVPLITYEGGSDSFAAPANGCTTLQHDSGMYALYTNYYAANADAGVEGPFMQYTHVGACWGLKEKTSDSLAVSPKYRAVVDWVAAHP